jgi:hypothetical protein
LSFRDRIPPYLVYFFIMPLLSDMAEKMKDRAAALVSGLRAGKFLSPAAELVKGWEEKFQDLLPPFIREKAPWLEGKIVVTPAALVLVLIILLVIVAGLSSKGPEPDEPAAAAGIFTPLPIPPEDLFLPEEPDFLPPVILERERREFWTGEDAGPFWYRPREDGEEFWREQMEKLIDDLLERVP